MQGVASVRGVTLRALCKVIRAEGRMKEEGKKVKKRVRKETTERGRDKKSCCNQRDEREVAEEERREEVMNLIGERKERIRHGKTAEKEDRKWRQMSLEIQLLVSDSMFKIFQLQILLLFFLTSAQHRGAALLAQKVVGSIAVPEAFLSGFSKSNRQLSSKAKEEIKQRKRKNPKVNKNSQR